MQTILSFSSVFRFSEVLKFIKTPFAFFLFLYFLTISGDLLNVCILVFNFKLNNLIAFISAVLFFFTYGKRLILGKTAFVAGIWCLSSLVISTALGYNQIACLGFVLFFVFNYFFYFVYPLNLFFLVSPDFIFKFYFFSFICVGCYALAQVLFSCFGIILPFVGQYIFTIARGQGFSYEPSYYALYMTPYTMFCNAKYLLEPPDKRRARDIFISNMLLLISTSTGCFFSYIFFFFVAFLFKSMGYLNKVSLSKVLSKLIFYGACSFFVLLLVNPNLVEYGFLKFFYKGFSHYSFVDRWEMIVRYWYVFLAHIWVGTGLGGATTYLLLEQGATAIDFLDPMVLRSPTLIATNVSMELLASLGIVGACCFGYMGLVIWKILRKGLKIPHLTQDEKIIMQSLVVSIFVTICTLQFSQSIMRAYIWLHVGICVGYSKYLQFKYLNINNQV